MHFSVVIHCIVGETRGEALDRAQLVYASRERDEGFPEWLDDYTRQRIVDSVDETPNRLREYERAGCDRVIVIHPKPL
jgi:alkanesulfonate monooxygenase SsuD/methylene tetrahydromethanopterin reductase-like flavin-dependent oxidoreductase (luciferase family)